MYNSGFSYISGLKHMRFKTRLGIDTDNHTSPKYMCIWTEQHNPERTHKTLCLLLLLANLNIPFLKPL